MPWKESSRYDAYTATVFTTHLLDDRGYFRGRLGNCYTIRESMNGRSAESVLLDRDGGVTVMKHRACSELGIKRSRLGWLSVRFDGGPFYPEMLDALQQAVINFGGLVRRGESLTAAEWLQRIDAIGGRITSAQILAIRTLMSPE